jgi:hypothetical protein
VTPATLALLERVTDPVPGLLDTATELVECSIEWYDQPENSRFVPGNLAELAAVLADLRTHLEAR